MASSIEVESPVTDTIPTESQLPATSDEEEQRQESVLATGILGALKPAVQQIDEKVEQVR